MAAKRALNSPQPVSGLPNYVFSFTAHFCSTSICSCCFCLVNHSIYLFRPTTAFIRPKSAASFSIFFTIGASSFIRFWYLSACFYDFSTSCQDSCKSSCKKRISSSTCNSCSCKFSLIYSKVAFSSCNSAFSVSSSATSFARSFFLKSRTNKCFSCMPFLSHSIPCSSMTAASCSFS